MHTVARMVRLAGTGLHSGAECTAVVHPAAGEGGIWFRAAGERFRLEPAVVRPSQLCSRVEGPHGGAVSTVEHLLAALHALQVWGVEVEVQGPEVPILDGSALPFAEALLDAGMEGLGDRAPTRLRPRREARFTAAPGDDTGTTIDVRPADDPLCLSATTQFPGVRGSAARSALSARPRPHAPLQLPPATVTVDTGTLGVGAAPPLLGARTFCFERDVQAMRDAGLIQGGSLGCALVLRDDGAPVAGQTMRMLSEPAHHKALDLLGDLALLGAPLCAHVSASRPGHDATRRFLQWLAADVGLEPATPPV